MNQRLLLLFLFGCALQLDAQEGGDRPPLTIRVLDSVEVKLSDRSIFYRRITPPLATVAPLAPAELQRTVVPTADVPGLTLGKSKEHRVLFLSATVYHHAFTEMRWWNSGHEFRALSNVDFNHLSSVSEVETEDSVYFLFLIVDNSSHGLAPQSEELSLASTLNSGRAAYLTVPQSATATPNALDLSALDALHRYYDIHRSSLAEDYARRESERMAAGQWREEHPPTPKDTVINYWPRKSRMYPSSVR